jgi:hypothetical protein
VPFLLIAGIILSALSYLKAVKYRRSNLLLPIKIKPGKTTIRG